jgi:hypothetical protein
LMTDWRDDIGITPAVAKLSHSVCKQVFGKQKTHSMLVSECIVCLALLCI